MFDESKAERALKFIGLLKHTEGKWDGVTFKETMLPEQEQWIRRISFQAQAAKVVKNDERLKALELEASMHIAEKSEYEKILAETEKA